MLAMPGRKLLFADATTPSFSGCFFVSVVISDMLSANGFIRCLASSESLDAWLTKFDFMWLAVGTVKKKTNHC